ncbi:hypothetical protein FB45DRAFT_877421 [Roridomyces roridus]|uniref:Uncharacterized protein n=1 Tax=Roridomyces roridus TaxID=1738132 RepID=A0AAD7FAH6_9AGAR|nr:hypothetical protein FB45DRAFT_877421 [Roridomyces roridus]
MITHKRAKDCSPLSNPYGQGPCDLLLNVICGSTPPESKVQGAWDLRLWPRPTFPDDLEKLERVFNSCRVRGGRDFTAPVPWTPRKVNATILGNSDGFADTLGCDQLSCPHPQLHRRSDGSVRFGSRSGTFLLNAERERSVREPERTFAFSSAFERVRTPDFPVII